MFIGEAIQQALCRRPPGHYVLNHLERLHFLESVYDLTRCNVFFEAAVDMANEYTLSQLQGWDSFRPWMARSLSRRPLFESPKNAPSASPALTRPNRSLS